VRQRLRGWRRKWLPLAPCWRQPFCPSVSASVGGPDQRVAQAADGAPIGRPLFKDRLAIVVLCDPIRALLGYKAFGRSLKVAFDKMIPTKHPYIAAFSKPRPVGRRRGRPTLSSSRPASGIQTHLLAPTMHCIRAFPESL